MNKKIEKYYTGTVKLLTSGTIGESVCLRRSSSSVTIGVCKDEFVRYLELPNGDKIDPESDMVEDYTIGKEIL